MGQRRLLTINENIMTINNKKSIRNLSLAASMLAFTIFGNAAEASNKKVYFGGGYQLTSLSFTEPESLGSFTTTETIERIDESQTIEILNPDGTTTTTTTTEFVDVDKVNSRGDIDLKDYFSSKYKNFNVFVGANLNQQLSVELGFFRQEQSQDFENDNPFEFDGKSSKNTSSLQIVSLDMVFNFPMDEAERFYLTPTIGGSMVSFETQSDFYENGSLSDSESSSSNDLGLNLGLGIETRITETIALRSNVKVVLMPSSDVLQRIIISSVGLKISL